MHSKVHLGCYQVQTGSSQDCKPISASPTHIFTLQRDLQLSTFNCLQKRMQPDANTNQQKIAFFKP